MNLVDSLVRVALLGSTWVLWLLLALSVLSIAAMVERGVFFRRNRSAGDGLRRALAEAARGGEASAIEDALKRHRSVEADVLGAALGWASSGADAFRAAVDSELAARRKELDRSLTLLGTLGNNAPFVGLFGTVLGVIEAFHHLSGGAGEAAMGQVMSGIAEALVATGVGIFVAIPAVVAYNVAQKKVADIEADTLGLARLIDAWLHARERGTAPSAPADASDEAEPETRLELAAAE